METTVQQLIGFAQNPIFFFAIEKNITDGSCSEPFVIVFSIAKKNRILSQTNQLLNSSFHM